MPTDSNGISPIDEADIPDAMALVAEAGWNQIEADWRFMLANGRGYGILDAAGRLIASSIILTYPPSIGWIGMVLVAGAHRKRGYATRLLRHAIDMVALAGRTPMLDATPAGREVYVRLGFSDGEPIERWRGAGRGTGKTRPRIIDLDTALRLDATAFGASRAMLIADLAARPDAACFNAGGGVLLSRRGRTATQLGPLLATSDRTAAALLDNAIGELAGPLLLDVPARETELRKLLAKRGFAVERPFTRMALGGAAAIHENMRVIAGPELG